MVLVLAVALLSALVRLIHGGIHGGLSILLAMSPPLLSMLVLVFERPSPAKYWRAGVLISLFLPALAVSLDVLAAGYWWFVGERPGILVLLCLANVVGVVALIRVAWLLPRRCPKCGLRTWLPLGRRSAPLLWCASCSFRERAGRPATTH
jgi:hypothetical protein